MTSNNTNILDNFKDGDKYQQECLLKRGFHDYESINSQQISKNIVETEYICLDCGDLKCVYNYLEDDDENWLLIIIIIIIERVIIKELKEGK